MDISIDQLSYVIVIGTGLSDGSCDTCSPRPASKQRFMRIRHCQAPFICSGVQLEMLWINICNVYYCVGVVIPFSAYPKVSSTFRRAQVCATEIPVWQQVVFVFFWLWAVAYSVARDRFMTISRVKIKQSRFCTRIQKNSISLIKLQSLEHVE